jgi:broad specificity phosphatase PhoE
MELFLIRHGETEWSKTGQHTGRTELPLTEHGTRQGRQLAPVVAGLLDGRSWAAAYSSPLERARDTLALVLPRVDHEVVELLREFDYGDYEGRSRVQIQESVPGWEIWRDGCPNGETCEQAGARADLFLEKYADVGGPVAVCSHGHFSRILAARALGLPPELGQIFAMPTGTVSVIKDYHAKRAIFAWNHTGDVLS